MGLIRFLLIAISFYLIFKVLTRFILPWFVKYSLKRFQTKFYEQNPHIRPDVPKKEGEVTIKKVSHDKDGKIPDDLGDYVDYEDVK